MQVTAGQPHRSCPAAVHPEPSKAIVRHPAGRSVGGTDNPVKRNRFSIGRGETGKESVIASEQVRTAIHVSPGAALAGLEGMFAVLALMFGVAPPVSGGDRVGDCLVGVGFLLLSLLTLTTSVAHRSPLWQDVSILGAGVLAAAFTANSISPQRQTLSAMILVSLGALAGYARRGWRLAALLTWLLVWYLAALTLHELLPGSLYFVFAAVTVLGVSAVISTLSDQVEYLAQYDTLTGALSRSGLSVAAESVAAVSRRSRTPVTVAIIDLDAFKVFNDRHGHLAGDRLLADLASAWRAALRRGDLLARFGGDEFVLVLPATDLAGAEVMVKRLRLAHPAAWTVGTSTWAPDEDLFRALHAADQSLYAAKGRPSAAPQPHPLGPV